MARRPEVAQPAELDPCPPWGWGVLGAFLGCWLFFFFAFCGSGGFIAGSTGLNRTCNAEPDKEQQPLVMVLLDEEDT